MITLKLMPDYHCYPLWGVDDDNWGNIDPHTLPISARLTDDLIQWASEYDNTLNMEDPLNSGFKNKEEELSFKNKGEKLRKRLESELGNNYSIFLKIVL